MAPGRSRDSNAAAGADDDSELVSRTQASRADKQAECCVGRVCVCVSCDLHLPPAPDTSTRPTSSPRSPPPRLLDSPFVGISVEQNKEIDWHGGAVVLSHQCL